MKSIYEEAGDTYIRQGNYKLSNLKVRPEREILVGAISAAVAVGASALCTEVSTGDPRP